MNEIAQMVSQKFNLSPGVSQQLVDFIVTQVKGKLPEGLSHHVDGLWLEVRKRKASWRS